MSLRALLSNTLAHHGEADWLTTSDGTVHFLRDALVDVLGMERHLEVKVRVGVDITASRGNREVLGELRRIPLEAGLDIAEVAHL